MAGLPRRAVMLAVSLPSLSHGLLTGGGAAPGSVSPLLAHKSLSSLRQQGLLFHVWAPVVGGWGYFTQSAAPRREHGPSREAPVTSPGSR